MCVRIAPRIFACCAVVVGGVSQKDATGPAQLPANHLQECVRHDLRADRHFPCQADSSIGSTTSTRIWPPDLFLKRPDEH